MFTVKKTENGYMLEVDTPEGYGLYVFERLAKLRKAIKEILDLEQPKKENE